MTPVLIHERALSILISEWRLGRNLDIGNTRAVPPGCVGIIGYELSVTEEGASMYCVHDDTAIRFISHALKKPMQKWLTMLGTLGTTGTILDINYRSGGSVFVGHATLERWRNDRWEPVPKRNA